MGKDEQQHSRIAGASVILLCFASGATDVLSYLTLGRIFTSAMTGAAALFFVALLGGKYPAAIRAAVALGSYMAGSGLAAALQPRGKEKRRAAPGLRRLLIAETIMLGGYSMASALGEHPLHGVLRYGLIFLSALAMGVQSVVARAINEPAIPTVVLNLTMTSIMVSVTRRVLRRGEAPLPYVTKLQMIALLGYAAGAMIAAASLVTHAAGTDILPLIAVLLVLGLYQYQARHEQN